MVVAPSEDSKSVNEMVSAPVSAAQSIVETTASTQVNDTGSTGGPLGDDLSASMDTVDASPPSLLTDTSSGAKNAENVVGRINNLITVDVSSGDIDTS